ncbi:MAG: cation transporter [Anaerolineaceae bacterium]|nr:MAG: cation transporter [Anaerolineaceae bacterium]
MGRREQRTTQAVRIGLIANILLAGLKNTIGIIGHSPALLADGINSTSDVAYYLVVAVFMRQARKPPDEEYPYGYRQMESIAGVAVGAFVIATAVAIFWDAINTVYDFLIGVGDQMATSTTALIVALSTVILKIFLTFYTRWVGEETKSAAVIALAYDHRNDIFSALAATIGILFARFGYKWMDPLAGALVAIVILRTGVMIIRDSSIELMSTKPDADLLTQVHTLIANVTGVRAVEEVFVHRFGPYLVLNITLGIDGSMSVQQGDRISTLVEDILLKQIDFLSRVHIHYHPASESSM